MSNVVSFPVSSYPRWKAVCEYNSDEGAVVYEHCFEEIEQLHGIIERGPDWNTLVRCTVTLNRPARVSQ